MIKNKFLIFIILILALLSIGVASAQDLSSNTTDAQDSVSVYDESNVNLEEIDVESNNICESSNNDSEDVVLEDNEGLGSQVQSDNVLGGTSNSVVTFKEVQDVIDQLHKWDMNELNFGTWAVDVKYSDGDSKIVVNYDNFVIDGAGHTLDGDGKGAFFTILGNNVTIKNLNFINGYGFTPFNVNGANFRISNCSFINNTGFKTAGILGIYGNNGSVINCKFMGVSTNC